MNLEDMSLKELFAATNFADKYLTDEEKNERAARWQAVEDDFLDLLTDEEYEQTSSIGTK